MFLAKHTLPLLVRKKGNSQAVGPDKWASTKSKKGKGKKAKIEKRL